MFRGAYRPELVHSKVAPATVVSLINYIRGTLNATIHLLSINFIVFNVNQHQHQLHKHKSKT